MNDVGRAVVAMMGDDLKWASHHAWAGEHCVRCGVRRYGDHAPARCVRDIFGLDLYGDLPK